MGASESSHSVSKIALAKKKTPTHFCNFPVSNFAINLNLDARQADQLSLHKNKSDQELHSVARWYRLILNWYN